MREVSLEIIGFKDYSVTEDGFVFNNNYSISKPRRVLSQALCSGGYPIVSLGAKKKYRVHQLVAIGFLGYIPDGTNKIVVDHIDGNKTNNNVNNLQLISNRENSSKDQKKHSRTSQYVGVSWHNKTEKWQASIRLNNKSIGLSLFDSDVEASEQYQSALKQIMETNDLDRRLLPKPMRNR